MPSKSEHRAKAEHNERFVGTLAAPYFDWAVCGTFYTALHYVESYLATKNIHPQNHTVRLGIVQRDPKLKPVFRDYRELLNESRDARYEPAVTFTAADVTRLAVHLESIKQVVLPLI